MSFTRFFALAAVVVAGALPGASANAQYYGPVRAGQQPQPLYPYVSQRDETRASRLRADFPYVSERRAASARVSDARHGRRKVLRSEEREARGSRRITSRDPVERSIEGPVRYSVVNAAPRVVYERPVVIEKRRIVDAPERVIERRIYVDDTLRARQQADDLVRAKLSEKSREKGSAKGVRIIRAEAEVKIIGKDQMSIRLFRAVTRNKAARAEAPPED